MKRRVAFGIEYDGTDFIGWQHQKHGRSVQEAVDAALSFVAGEAVTAVCAGRTDAGVHAECQVVHIDTAATREERAWVMGANSRLPRSVAVRWAKPVAPEFHARYSATSRRYRYEILNRAFRPGLVSRYVAWEHAPLQDQAMHAAAQALLGEHDFSAFRSLACQAKNPVRTMHAIQVARHDDCVVVHVRANAFLHHMVRNIVGSLLPVGRGEQSIEWIAELLEKKNRALAGATALAGGLFFIGPLYPAKFGLPTEIDDEMAQPVRG